MLIALLMRQNIFNLNVIKKNLINPYIINIFVENVEIIFTKNIMRHIITFLILIVINILIIFI